MTIREFCRVNITILILSVIMLTVGGGGGQELKQMK